MPALKNIEQLETWMDERPFEEGAAIALRIALRGLRPLFTDANSIVESNRCLSSMNAALVCLILPKKLGDLRRYLQALLNSSSVSEADTAVARLNHYEAASARRHSRASSSNEKFADGVLERAATETTKKLRQSQDRAARAVARAMGVLSVELIQNRHQRKGLVGLVSRVQPIHQRISLWERISADCEFLDRTGSIQEVFATSLWDSPERPPDALIQDTAPNPFWVYWYFGFVGGVPLEWEMLADIALVSASTGADEYEVNMQTISHVELRHLRAMAYQPERIVLGEGSGLFKVVPDTIADPRRYQNALRKIQEDIDRIQSIENSNSYSALDDVFVILNNTLENHQHEPMYVHDDFVKSLRMIIRKIERQDIPPFDDYIDNLMEDLNTSSIDIRATDEGVARAVASRARIKLRKPNLLEARSLTSQIEMRSAQSEPPLAAQLQADWKTLREIDAQGNHEIDPEPEQAVQRMANRLPQMQTGDASDFGDPKVDRVVDAAEKAAKLQKGAQAAEYGWSWLQYLLSMF